jgi:hypothetical protein
MHRVATFEIQLSKLSKRLKLNDSEDPITSALYPFPTSPQYFSLICDPFADPIISLHSPDISLFDCHI